MREHAKFLDQAFLERREVDRITLKEPSLSIDEGYRIQDDLIALRLGRGEKVIGLKMGLTSRAKMKQMGIDSPIYGVLTDAMKVEGRFDTKGAIHAKIEPEIAFLIRDELKGSVTAERALAACSGVCAAMEIIDSRFRDFKFELPDVIADNCSSHAFVMGDTVRDPREIDLGNLGMILEVDGKPVQFGSSAAILDHPLESLLELCRLLERRGRSIPAGSIVLAGAATLAVPLLPGARVRALVQDLGEASVTT
ncbi:MAG TPA: fumarylacetoacetate hydrolase family protein [Bdellovibrionota bacterium]|nr:fumarylacetoacetate hydrolase family protein [Bdellovibrionota bacterium]